MAVTVTSSPGWRPVKEILLIKRWQFYCYCYCAEFCRDVVGHSLQTSTILTLLQSIYFNAFSWLIITVEAFWYFPFPSVGTLFWLSWALMHAIYDFSQQHSLLDSVQKSFSWDWNLSRQDLLRSSLSLLWSPFRTQSITKPYGNAWIPCLSSSPCAVCWGQCFRTCHTASRPAEWRIIWCFDLWSCCFWNENRWDGWNEPNDRC